MKLIAKCLLLLVIGISAGCSRPSGSNDVGEDLIPIVLQTDWFAQPEHGGFYQALAKGYYQAEGLDVTILTGGPNAMSLQKVLRGRAHFAMNRADFVLKHAAGGVPLLMVMATLQHDPQGIMLHASNPVSSIRELDGKQVMAVPGLTWIQYVERKFNIELQVIPHDFGLERFIRNPEFIQQCLLTNEPFYMRQRGVAVKTLPMRETGFDPYHGIYCLGEFAESHPDIVGRFVRASQRGWEDFADGDPSPALELIRQRNPRMNDEFMAFSYETLLSEGFVATRPRHHRAGNFSEERMGALQRELIQLEMISGDPPREWWTNRFLEP